ncbi:hypothetical protein TWF694_001952 [Orbilia ellipsospora]|uniref:Uncharacterized protein n=1 Tax=Orbilia ellipsospora TaxID=2528407 RepID=A0AAV9X454_9PEZI
MGLLKLFIQFTLFILLTTAAPIRLTIAENSGSSKSVECSREKFGPECSVKFDDSDPVGVIMVWDAVAQGGEDLRASLKLEE